MHRHLALQSRTHSDVIRNVKLFHELLGNFFLSFPDGFFLFSQESLLLSKLLLPDLLLKELLLSEPQSLLLFFKQKFLLSHLLPNVTKLYPVVGVTPAKTSLA